MKRKLLAGLLALVMVISLLPVSVFAAEAAVCPGDDVDHNLTNCPTAVKGETVAPSCGTWGYTLYECPVCHEHFADDFQPYANVEHTLKVIEPQVDATCLDDGKKAVTKCEICEKTFGGEVIPATGHVPGKPVVVDGVITTKCSVCGEVITSVECAHKWITPPVVDKEPTLTEKGLAIYTCADCGKTKEVPINPTCDHANKIVDVPKKEANCLEAGYEAYSKCSVCELIWKDNTCTEQLDEPIVIPATGHEFDIADGATEVAGTRVESTCDEEGSVTVICGNPNCDVTNVNSIEKKEHNFSKTVIDYKPTCTTYGYTGYACIDCGYIEEIEKIDKLGHTPRICPDADGAGAAHDETKCAVCKDAALSKNVAETAATCQKDGKWTWNCGRDGCGIEQSETITAPGHNLVVAEYEALCHRFAYTVTYCTNEECDIEKTLVDLNGDEDEVTVMKTNDAAPVYSITIGTGADAVTVVAEYPIDVVTGKSYFISSIVVDATNGLDPNNHTRDNIRCELINAETCTEDGNEVFYCAYCDHYKSAVRPATGHNYVPTNTVVTPAECGKNAIIVYECSNALCPEKRIEDEAPNSALEHDWQEEIVPATCINEGHTAMKCSLCQEYKPGTMEVEPKHEYDIEYSWEEASNPKFAHKIDLSNPDSKEIIRANDPCNMITLYHFTCDLCNKGVLVVKEAEHTWVETGAKVPAECGKPGKEATSECSVCHETKGGEAIDALEHNEVIDEPAVNATCETDGKNKTSHCSICNAVMGDGATIPALGHKYKEVDSAARSCEQFRYKHIECSRCGEGYITQYKAAMGHDIQKVDALSTEATCEQPGREVFECKNGCGKKNSTNILLQLPHQNAAGEILTGKCTDTATDLACVNGCMKDRPKEHSAGYTTGKYFEATCISYGYTLHICDYCGDNYVENDAEDVREYGDHQWKYNKRDVWFIETEATYHETGMRYRECELCGDKEHEVIPMLNGFGLSIEADNALKPGAVITVGSQVKVTIALDSNWAAWGYVMDVTFDADALTFAKADFSSSMFNANATYTTPENVEVNGSNIGTIKIAANYPAVNGSVVDAEIKEEFVLVDLYFDVAVIEEIDAETYVYVDAFTLLTADGEDLEEVIFDDYMEKAGSSDPKVQETAVWPTIDIYVNAEVEIDRFLDVDNSGEFDALDCQLAYKMLIGDVEEGGALYDAVIDVDKDGNLTADDVQYLYGYLVGNYTFEELVEAKA